MVMHLAISLITYNCLVHIAKVEPVAHGHARSSGSEAGRVARRGS
jgi:hypothetical protein